MKRGNDEEKLIGPLFPRLHVNDTEKGGPRAPPRNKMALYEQLTIPSQRFSPVATVRSLPSHSTSNTLIPSASSNQDGCRMSSACYISSTALSHLANCYNSNSSNPLNVKDANEHENQSENNMNYKSSNDMGILYTVESEAKETQRLENNTNYKSSDAVGISYSVKFNVKEPHWKETPEEDDFRVPTFVQSKLALTSNKCQGSVNQTISQASPPKELMIIDKIVQTLKTTPNSSPQNKKSSENNPQLNTSKDAILTARRAKDHTDPCSQEEYQNNPVKMCEHQSSGNNASLPLEKQIIEHDSRAQTESDVQTLLTKSIDDVHRSHWFSQEGDNISETSTVDSISGIDISSDDVVGIVGHKNFWKARRLILNQQRVFALQVFELHRIWKVQKLIAASPPQSLFQDEPYSKVLTNKSSPEMCFKSQEQNIEAKQVVTHLQQNMKKPNSSCLAQNMRKPFSYIPKYEFPQPSPIISNAKSNPWCLTPNQFLVPFISPSEEFFYKSCAGPYPPHQSYMEAMNQRRMNAVSTLNSQMSINASDQNGERFSCYVRNNLTSRDSDIQGRIESSHRQKPQGTKAGNVSEGKEILHLFPSTPNVKDHGQASESLTCKDNESRVIKVVPYNSFSATESAARIFQSIQEEKRQHHRN